MTARPPPLASRVPPTRSLMRIRDYTPRMREALAGAAERVGVPIGRGLRTVGASDALIALRAGYPRR